MTPFTQLAQDRLSHIGEMGLLECIQEWIQPVSPKAPFGFGDDCAVIDVAGGPPMLLTVDGLIWGQHFDASASAEAAGLKLLKRNLSDLAAMGGEPGPAVVALVAGNDLSVNWLKAFYQGMVAGCQHYGVTVVGGDVSSGPEGYFSAHMTLCGRAETYLKRSGARIGDALMVTGELGGSLLGKHLSFTPRLAEGRWLASSGWVSSCLDVTDGIAKDGCHLLPDSAAMALDLEHVPISEAAETSARRSGQPAWQHALCDGEDYELCFTLDRSVAVTTFQSAWQAQFDTPVHHIGTLVPLPESAEGRCLNAATGASLQLKGFEHYSM